MRMNLREKKRMLVVFGAFVGLVLGLVVAACSGHDAGEEEMEGTVGYIVGYETCGLSLETWKAKGYVVISEDLKDTLAVYGLPDIFEFPEEAFTETASAMGVLNAAFREEFRYAFKMRFTYTPSTEQEVLDLELKASCIILWMYPITATYENCVPVIIDSAVKTK